MCFFTSLMAQYRILGDDFKKIGPPSNKPALQGAIEDVWSKLFKICPDLPELSKIEWKVKIKWNASLQTHFLT